MPTPNVTLLVNVHGQRCLHYACPEVAQAIQAVEQMTLDQLCACYELHVGHRAPVAPHVSRLQLAVMVASMLYLHTLPDGVHDANYSAAQDQLITQYFMPAEQATSTL